MAQAAVSVTGPYVRLYTPRISRFDRGASRHTMQSTDTVRIDSVCLHSAGRSQVAAAFAERLRRAGTEGVVEVHSDGAGQADAVHGVTVEATAEAGIGVADRRPGHSPAWTCSRGAAVWSSWDVRSRTARRRAAGVDPREPRRRGDRNRPRDEIDARVTALCSVQSPAVDVGLPPGRCNAASARPAPSGAVVSRSAFAPVRGVR
ncbi:MAG: protein-tyrosine-phosphatase [uncultured archaeon A07HB70]|nr:MAG: protein-tyrosine-phosphatase [uncultured archaeon A07HB70]